MRKTSALLSLLLLLTSCSCVGVQVRPGESDVRDMMDTTVQIEVQVAATVYILNKDSGLTMEITEGWVGSGVVYEKSLGLLEPVKSKILTANHVLEAPPVGTEVEIELGPMKIPAILHIDAVMMTVKTRGGRTCSLEPIALGVSDQNDVATGLADCDAGQVAKIADSVPPAGAEVFVSGHPLGIGGAIVTSGWVSGWWNGYLLISAGAAPGNSGGPIFYDGKVVSLLVRGAPRYPNISLGVPLKVIQERIGESE